MNICFCQFASSITRWGRAAHPCNKGEVHKCWSRPLYVTKWRFQQMLLQFNWGGFFQKQLFPSAYLHFGCCESRWGKICCVCIGAKNWRRIYKSAWTATASGSLDWSSWWRRGLIYAPKSVSWDLRLQFSKEGPCTEITMGVRHWWSTCGLCDGVCSNPLVVWQGLAYEPMKGVMCISIL